MIWNAKNGTVPVGNTKMSYVSFGSGNKVLILLPGLSDGMITVKGKALLLAAPYKLLTCPTLIIGGEADKIVGRDASYKMHELIKGSELYMYEKYGHAAYEEADDFYKRVFDFLDR